MTRQVFAECVEEMAERADPAPAVDAATRAMRRNRSVQLDEVDAVVNGGSFYARGFRSPTDWLVVTTREGVGFCKLTLHLADRIQKMPVIRAAFADGILAESSLRLLADAWVPTIADQFAHDERMLCGWATTMPHADFRLVLDTWRMRADPDREAATDDDRFDSRALHLSRLLDGVGVIDGKLDPEGFTLLREAIRLHAQPADGETRSAAQRRADALVTIARMAVENHLPVPGRKRRKARVVATIAYDDLVDTWHAQQAPGAHTTADESRTTVPEARRPMGGALDTDTDRILVSSDAVRRVACDCNIHRYVTNPLGTVVDFGRSQRVVSDSLFDTLLVRDHGCRWAGCAIPAGGCDAHHAIHWLDNGETTPDNLVLLCWFHHHLLHEQHWSIEPLGGGHFNLNDPHGNATVLRPPLVGLALPGGPLSASVRGTPSV
ncbi:MAG: DUF222 domain-containing protein [Ilumatobacter sp.]|uniref:HNH endonuclease signature motif containing protein n=1 Tax=Ilumatobacter sp. TaxID=1967498 RepID=UPI0032970CE1